jgi:lactam utilization protein B
MKAAEIENLVAYQIGALQAIATAAGHKVTQKPRLSPGLISSQNLRDQ